MKERQWRKPGGKLLLLILRKLLAYVIIPLAIGLAFVWKAFYVTDCYAFENNDEAAHTFVEIKLAWSMLRAGHLPLMNLYNNFGTPLLGDPIILVFAPHSISYLLFPAPLAATINRLAAIALTVALLTYFYHHRFSFSLATSSLCASLGALLPSYNYFSMHHPHQGVLVYFVTVLIMQYRFRNKPDIKNLVALYLALLIFALSVGLNAFLFGVPFLLVSQMIEAQFRLDKPFVLSNLILLAAFLPVAPHLAYFLKITPLTARTSLNFATFLPFTPQRLLTDMVTFANLPEILHVSLTVYYSLPVLGLAVFGLFKTPNKRDLSLVLGLGCLPIVFVLSVLAFGNLRDYLPFLKPVDVGRLLWFANVYFLAAAGYALEAIRKSAVTMRSAFIAIGVAMGVLVSGLWVVNRYIFIRYAAILLNSQIVVLISILLLLVAVGMILAFRLRWLRNTLGVIALALSISFLPVLDYQNDLVSEVKALMEGNSIGCESTFFHTPFTASFHPAKFLQAMTPFSRMTAQFDPISQGALQSVANFNIFGSDGRSIILSQQLRDYLVDKGLVQFGWFNFTYYFTSTDLEELSRLGIKYVITGQLDEFREAGWLLKDADPDEGLNLFENPREISLAYMDEGVNVQYIPTSQITYRDNGIDINLQSLAPAKETDLVLTFVNWPGWKASVDGQAVALGSAPDPFLRVKVGAEAQAVKFTFAPVTLSQLLTYLGLSVLLLFLAITLLKFSPSAAPFFPRSEQNPAE
jgi:hypothetical protein